MDFYSGDKLVISTNARGMMKFEHLREKNEETAVEAENEPDMWEESYGGHSD